MKKSRRSRSPGKNDPDASLRQHLVELLKGGELTYRSPMLWLTSLPRNAVLSRMDYSIPVGSYWNISASRNGTYSNSAASRNTNHRIFQAATGRRQPSRRMMLRGRKV